MAKKRASRDGVSLGFVGIRSGSNTRSHFPAIACAASSAPVVATGSTERSS